MKTERCCHSVKIRKLVASMIIAFISINLIASVGHAASLDEISKEQQAKQSSMAAVDSQISETLVSLNEKNKEIEDLNTQIADKKASLSTTATQIKEKQASVDERIEQAKKRLQTLQTSEVNKNMVLVMMESESVTDFFNRAIMVGTLQSADNDKLELAVKEKEELAKLESKLKTDAVALEEKTVAVDKQSKELNTKMVSLQKTMDDNKAALDELDKQKQSEQKRVDDEASAKQAAEAAAKQAAETKAVAVPAADTTPVATPATPNALTPSTGGGASSGKTVIVESTAYSVAESASSFYTALGIDLRQNPMVIAVDPRVIPLGSRVEVSGYGTAIAGDTGGAIKGNKIDVHFSSVAQCLQWGRRTVTVKILN